MDALKDNLGMDDISFTTFLKISLLPSTLGKFGALQRLLNGTGGYDFYKRMKLAAREVARGELDREVILAQLGSIKREAERTHNIAMATRFGHWWDSLEGASGKSGRPSGVYRQPGMAFGIKMQPELAYEQNGQLYVTYLWAIDRPKLTKQSAGGGLYLLRSQLGLGEYSSALFQIRDLRQQKTLGEDCIDNASANLVQADIATLNAMWVGNLPEAA